MLGVGFQNRNCLKKKKKKKISLKNFVNDFFSIIYIYIYIYIQIKHKRGILLNTIFFYLSLVNFEFP